MQAISHYPPIEERINIASHAIGLLLSVAALVVLVIHASLHGNAWHIVSFSIFGSSLIILYAASTIYHSAKEPRLRSRLRVMDHASIYVLIAGTYTPFTLVTLNGVTGWTLFGITWGLAVSGIILKLFFTGQYNVLSTLMYIFMGWIIVFAIKPLVNNLPVDGLFWLVAGGVAYTIGAILYGIKKIKFNHSIFHVFVLLGSSCHFVAIYFYVLPE
ncbi:MAG: hemolysin III family protein [Gammaproteobacteria bacterium]|jgi:hemolysin III|nr:hemolysin III family protein [Gammaproteobacteria bacterium]